jgi:excisionase family DNA binding protein
MSNSSDQKLGDNPRGGSTPSPLLDREEAAELLSISLRHLDTLVAAGELTPVRIGRAVRFRPEEIDAFIQKSTDGIDSSS